MQSIFNCCHGMLEANGRWICSSGADCGSMDEEVIGDDPVGGFKQVQSARGQDPPMIGRGPPRPIAEQETKKLKLQNIIRGFAHDVVGSGLDVEAQSLMLEAFSPTCTLEAMLLRMDRRLSRLELWPPPDAGTCGSDSGGLPTLALPLHQVEDLVKGSRSQGEAEPLDPSRDACTLTVASVQGQDLRLIFDSPATRDCAYTCLRIFQMSVDRSGPDKDAEPESTAGITGLGGMTADDEEDVEY